MERGRHGLTEGTAKKKTSRDVKRYHLIRRR